MLDRDFLASAAYGRVTEIVHFITLYADGDEGKRFGPARLSELGLAVGNLLDAHGVPSAIEDPSDEELAEGLVAPADIWIIEETRNGHFQAQLRLARSDGRVDLRFSDGSVVVLSSLAHETNGHANSILCPGASFLGESGASYVTGRMIGTGGTAHVYQARNQRGMTFAAKCLASDRFDLADLQGRFEREIEHLRQVQHDNVIGYVDQAYWGEHLILVMALAGETMANRLVKQEPDLGTALRWLTEILAGVSHLHSHHLVHRDLTPKNIMFGDDGAIKISDFGTVRSEEDLDLTSEAANARLGSLIYISDQQRQNPHDVQPSDDVFSIGQIAYRLLSGCSPQGNPPPLASFLEIPDQIARVVERMRSYQRRDRFEDASVALGALSQACEGLPISPGSS